MRKGDRVQIRMRSGYKFATVVAMCTSASLWVHIDGNKNPSRVFSERVESLPKGHIAHQLNKGDDNGT